MEIVSQGLYGRIVSEAVTLRLEDGEVEGIEIFFWPGGYPFSEDEVSALRSATREAEQEEALQNLSDIVKPWLFADGCRFGLRYAYDVYCRETGHKPKVKAYVCHIHYFSGTANDKVAYLCAFGLWQGLGHVPANPPYFQVRVHRTGHDYNRFFFPGADRFPIGQRTLWTLPNDIKENQELFPAVLRYLHENEEDYFRD
jgi:hypothetical protein